MLVERKSCFIALVLDSGHSFVWTVELLVRCQSISDGALESAVGLGVTNANLQL